MSTDKGRSKDIDNFHHLCKGLYRFIQRRIIKTYVNPNISNNSVHNSIEVEKDKQWKYYVKENISEEERILDIFKDNVFLSKVQSCYEILEIINNYLDENIKNVQFLQKNIEVGEKKIELLSQLNTQLNQFFKKNSENITQIKNNAVNNNNGPNNNNVLGRLNLVKSLNILNDLQIINTMNDVNKQDNNNNPNTSNTTITNNNNIILDNKIINNNINKEKMNIISEDRIQNTYDNKYDNKNELNPVPTPKFLNKKSKRVNNDNEEYNDIYNNSNNNNKGKNTFTHNNNKFKKKKFFNKNKQNKNKNPANTNNNNINNNTNTNNTFNDKDTINNNPEKNTIIEENSTYDTPPIPLDENEKKEEKEKEEKEEKEKPNEQSVKQIEIQNENHNENEKEKDIFNEKDNNNNDNSLEIEFDKVLKKEFYSIFDNSQVNDSKRDIIREISIILKKIPNMKFNRISKFDEPYLVGSYSHFNIIYLLDYLPPIDILFKCKNIESLNELKDIATETMQKKICLKYIEISNDYDKKNEIVKIGNKCKIRIKNNDDFFIQINLIFVGINLNNFIQKEKSINRFFFSNSMSDNKGKILISLFFRRWRRKYKLFFIIPEFIDVIISFYFNENESLALIIEKIFYDLFSGEINLCSKNNNNISKDEDNIKAISGFVDEWFKSNEDRKSLNNAIITTQEFIMKNDFYSTFKNE